MKRKNTIEEMADRLYWYTYEADYGEYNDQEVNYIIDFLKKNDPVHEERINRAAMTFTLHKQDEPT